MKTKFDLASVKYSGISGILLVVLILTGCAPVEFVQIASGLKEVYPGQIEGYLNKSELPDGVTILPPPPQTGSTEINVDQEISRRYLSQIDSIRWKQAQIDANLDFPLSIDRFTEVLDIRISLVTAPHLYLLLTRAAADASESTVAAKFHFKRLRPFVVNGQPTCDPESESYLRNSGAYPSGHSAIGWTWALILSELFPSQVDAIIKKGREFGESRVACNLHWQSDVDEGRTMGSATVAALHGNEEFQHDLNKARKEIRRIIRNSNR